MKKADHWEDCPANVCHEKRRCGRANYKLRRVCPNLHKRKEMSDDNATDSDVEAGADGVPAPEAQPLPDGPGL